jgi:hypothetical protein
MSRVTGSSRALVWDRALYRERRCYICLRVIPETQGIVWPGHGFIVCAPACHDRVCAAERDYHRGGRRSRPEFLSALRAMRPERAA